MSAVTHNRREFLTYFSSVGLSSTLLPGVLWAKVQNQHEATITLAMLKDAAQVAGLDFTDDELNAILQGVNQSAERFVERRKISLGDASLPLAFIPLPPTRDPGAAPKPAVLSKRPAPRRPQDLEDVAFWPLVDLAHLLRTRQVKSVELTEMYLGRLKRYNPKLNCVVTLTDDLAMRQARQADEEIAAGRYKGPLHGIPWGAKDIIAVQGYPTTWGSHAFKDRVIDKDAAVVRLIADAGGVLVAKLATGELAGGDQWFGGRTNNPWNVDEGSSGSSAGPASATAGGLVTFGIGTETSGSILSPSSVCGATGLRPTFGRVSRTGVMTLSYTQDRVGPLCRYAEDCAVVLHAIAHPDGEDFSVTERPFAWDARLDPKKLRVGYLADAFDEDGRGPEWKPNDKQALDDLRAMGFTLVPFKLPDLPTLDASSSMGAEGSASFDDFVRGRKNAELSGSPRGNRFRQGYFTPAVEYLQAQRLRGLAVRAMADVTAPFDVYVAPYLDLRNLKPQTQPPTASLIMQHFTAANLCGYPCIAVPNGFLARGVPTAITFLGRPYGEAQMLAVAKAYQDGTKWHLRHPTL